MEANELLYLVGGLAAGWFIVSKLVGGAGGSGRPSDRLRELEDEALSAPSSRFQPVEIDGVRVSGEVVRLVTARKKIQAIKQLRGETGLDLPQAKLVVDKVELGRGQPLQLASPGESEGGALRSSVRGVPVSAEVRRLVAEEKLIHAIKQLRDETGIGLREAKGVIDDIVAEGRR